MLRRVPLPEHERIPNRLSSNFRPGASRPRVPAGHLAIGLAGLLELQRLAGNRATSAMISSGRNANQEGSPAARRVEQTAGSANRWDRPLGPAISAAPPERFASPLVTSQVQRLALVNAAHMDPKGKWVPTVDAAGRATRVDAFNLKLAGGPGPVPSGGNKPTVDPLGFKYLRAKELTKRPPFYRRMHLLNGDLGGPGNSKSNLVPGSQSLNSSHIKHFEDPAMQELANGNTLSTYWVKVSYQQPSKYLKSAGAKAAWENTVDEIWGGFTYTDAMGVNHAGAFNAEEDKPSLANKPKWKGL